MNVLVLMSGGFHPFHPGHLALYNSAKQAFPGADIVVGATNVQKDRPFSFKDKATLATIAGVDQGHFVEVNRQFSVKGEPNIEGRIQDADNTILIFVRSEKDADDPALQPWKLNPDGSIPMTKGSKNHPPRPTSDYLLPYAGNQKKLQPMTKHAYIAFLPVKKFSSNMTSATQIRNTWPTLDDQGKKEFAMNLYPATQQNSKLLATVVNILNRNLGETSEPVVASEKSAINKLKADKLKEHIQRMRPLMSEASAEQKLKLLKLMKGALKESQQGVTEGSYDNDPGIKHTRGSLLAKLEALPRGSDDFEWNRQRAIQHLKQGDTLRAKYYMMLMKRGEPGVAEGSSTMWEVSFDYGPHMSDTVKVKASSEDEAIAKVEAAAEKKGRNIMVNWARPAEQGVAEGEVDEAKIHFTDPSIKVNLYYIPPKLEAQGKVQNVAHNIPYSTVQLLIDRLMQKYPNMKAEYLVVGPVGQDMYGQRLEENQDYLEEK